MITTSRFYYINGNKSLNRLNSPVLVDLVANELPYDSIYHILNVAKVDEDKNTIPYTSLDKYYIKFQHELLSLLGRPRAKSISSKQYLDTAKELGGKLINEINNISRNPIIFNYDFIKTRYTYPENNLVILNKTTNIINTVIENAVENTEDRYNIIVIDTNNITISAQEFKRLSKLSISQLSREITDPDTYLLLEVHKYFTGDSSLFSPLNNTNMFWLFHNRNKGSLFHNGIFNIHENVD